MKLNREKMNLNECVNVSSSINVHNRCLKIFAKLSFVPSDDLKNIINSLLFII